MKLFKWIEEIKSQKNSRLFPKKNENLYSSKLSQRYGKEKTKKI